MAHLKQISVLGVTPLNWTLHYDNYFNQYKK